MLAEPRVCELDEPARRGTVRRRRLSAVSRDQGGRRRRLTAAQDAHGDHNIVVSAWAARAGAGAGALEPQPRDDEVAARVEFAARPLCLGLLALLLPWHLGALRHDLRAGRRGDEAAHPLHLSLLLGVSLLLCIGGEHIKASISSQGVGLAWGRPNARRAAPAARTPRCPSVEAAGSRGCPVSGCGWTRAEGQCTAELSPHTRASRRPVLTLTVMPPSSVHAG